MYDSTKKCTLRPRSRVKAHTYSNKIGGVSCLLMFFMRLGKTTQFFGSSIYVGTNTQSKMGRQKLGRENELLLDMQPIFRLLLTSF